MIFRVGTEKASRVAVSAFGLHNHRSPVTAPTHATFPAHSVISTPLERTSVPVLSTHSPSPSAAPAHTPITWPQHLGHQNVSTPLIVARSLRKGLCSRVRDVTCYGPTAHGGVLVLRNGTEMAFSQRSTKTLRCRQHRAHRVNVEREHRRDGHRVHAAALCDGLHRLRHLRIQRGRCGQLF